LGSIDPTEGRVVNAGIVNFYVDNSNIFHAGQTVAAKRGEPRIDFRVYFKSFLRLALKGRVPRELVWGGSVPPENDEVWSYLRDLGVQPDLIPRPSTGEHETVDHLIQLKMHRHVRKYRGAPGTIVLATGDGSGYYKQDGFLYDVEGFIDDGWRIEILSWEHSCHGELRKFAEKWGTFVRLDDYYEQITFVRNGRIVKPLTCYGQAVVELA